MKVFVGADAFGTTVRDEVVNYLKEREDLECHDLGTDKYYSIAEQVATCVGSDPDSSRGILVCGTGCGVTIVANKHPRVFAAFAANAGDAGNAQSINRSNVLTMSGMNTRLEDVAGILDAWFTQAFLGPCDASGGDNWSAEVAEFLQQSMRESEIPSACRRLASKSSSSGATAPVGSDRSKSNSDKWNVLRKDRTIAVVKGGENENTTFDLDVTSSIYVLGGSLRLTEEANGSPMTLRAGDFRLMPADCRIEIQYLEDSQWIFICDGAYQGGTPT